MVAPTTSPPTCVVTATGVVSITPVYITDTLLAVFNPSISPQSCKDQAVMVHVYVGHRGRALDIPMWSKDSVFYNSVVN